MAAEERIGTLAARAAGLLITLGSSLLLAVLLILLLSRQPLQAATYFFAGPFLNGYDFGNMLNYAAPLIFAGLGMAVAFTSSEFNLGGEGQIYLGGLAATLACLALPSAPGPAGILLALLAAAAASALLAGLSGFLKMGWRIDELITSFLLSGAVILVVDYLVTGPLDDPQNNLLATRGFAERFFLFKLLPPSNLNASLPIALAAAGLVWLLVFKTHMGYEMRICGLNQEFSRYGGINVQAYLVLPMVVSGALHGLAGGFAVLGTYHRFLKDFSAGVGWSAIAVALIARNNPLGVLPAALFFAYLEAGARAAMLHADVTFEIASIVQAAVFFLITARSLYSFARLPGRVRDDRL